MKTFKNFVNEATLKNPKDVNTDSAKVGNRISVLLRLIGTDEKWQIQPKTTDTENILHVGTLDWISGVKTSLRKWHTINPYTVINDKVDGWEYWGKPVFKDSKNREWKLSQLVKTDNLGGESGEAETGTSVASGSKTAPKAEWLELGLCMVYNAKVTDAWDEDIQSIRSSDHKRIFELSGIEGGDKVKYTDCKIQMDSVGNGAFDVLSGLESGGVLKHSGKLGGAISSTWEGGQNTYKSDIFFVNGPGISVKKSGGSQFLSGLLDEAVSTFKVSNDLYQKDDIAEYKTISEEISNKFAADLSEKLELTGQVTGLKNVWKNWLLKNREYKSFVDDVDKIYKKDPNISGKKQNRGVLHKSKYKSEDQFANAMIAYYASVSDPRGEGKKFDIRNLQWKHPDYDDSREELTSLFVKKFIPLYKKFTEDDSFSENIRTSVVSLFDRYEIHNELNSYAEKIFNDVSWKKYLVFESSSGCYKFGGTVGGNLEPSGTQPAIANYVLEAGFTKSKIEKIDKTFCEKYGKAVNVFVAFKTASGSPQSSVRATLGDMVNSEREYDKVLTNIINEEMQFFTEQLLMEGIFGRAVATFKKVASKIGDLIKRVYERVKNWFIDIANKGINVLMESFNVKLDQIKVTI